MNTRYFLILVCLVALSCNSTIDFHYLGRIEPSMSFDLDTFYSFSELAEEYSVMGRITSEFSTRSVEELGIALENEAKLKGANAIVIEDFTAITKDDCEGLIVKAALLRYKR